MYTLAKVLGWIIAIPFILLALFAFARFVSCGPDREVVKVAKAVAKIIADDIVKNGIPESLKNIKGLPYELEGCKKKTRYRKMGIPVIDVRTKKEADFSILQEGCIFVQKNKSYSINIWFLEDYKDQKYSRGKVKIFNVETYTGIGVSFKHDKTNNIYQYDPIGGGYSHHHGILCSAFNH